MRTHVNNFHERTIVFEKGEDEELFRQIESVIKLARYGAECGPGSFDCNQRISDINDVRRVLGQIWNRIANIPINKYASGKLAEFMALEKEV